MDIKYISYVKPQYWTISNDQAGCDPKLSWAIFFAKSRVHVNSQRRGMGVGGDGGGGPRSPFQWFSSLTG